MIIKRLQWIILTSVCVPVNIFADSETNWVANRLEQMEAQIAALQAQLDAHTGDENADHARYADTEAISGMNLQIVNGGGGIKHGHPILLNADNISVEQKNHRKGGLIVLVEAAGIEPDA